MPAKFKDSVASVTRDLRGLPRSKKVALAAAMVAVLVSVIAFFVLQRAGSLVAPFPVVAADISTLPALPPSTLNVPVIYDLTPVLEALEREVPTQWGTMDERRQHPTNDRVSFAFELERSGFSASLDGDTARLSATLRYRGRGWYDPPLAPEVSASCGTSTSSDDRPRALVAISSPLSLTEEWSLQGRARVDRVAAATNGERDQCRVTVFGIDVTERVINAARDQLEQNTHIIDQELARIDLKGRFEKYWQIVREPIRLTDDVWLLINPSAVHRGPTAGQGSTLEAFVGLTAAPQIVLGPRPTVDSLPLPPLLEATLDDGLHILLDAKADYEAASRLLTRELAGRTLEWGGNRVELLEIRLSGIGGGRIAVEVDFRGTARGRVFLVGTPTIDPATNEIWVPDLDFDVATRHLLVSGAAWMAHGDLTIFLRERARIPVAEIVALAREQLLRGLNRQLSEEVQLEGDVHRVEVLAVEANRASLIVRSHAQATARMDIRRVDPDSAAAGDPPTASARQER